MAAALVASLSFCGLTPRCLATESRKSDPGDPEPVAATAAAPPPTTASVVAATTINRFDRKFIARIEARESKRTRRTDTP